MKLSALLSPLLDAKVDHELIRAQIKAYEAEQSDALERRRLADAARQSKKRSRDITLRHSDKLLATRAEDKSLTSEIEPNEDKKVSKQRATRLPNEFEADIDFAVTVGLTSSQAQAEIAKFRDYWVGKPGSAGTKLDWQATWRNWARTAAERISKPREPPPLRGVQAMAMDFIKELENDGRRETQEGYAAYDVRRLSAPSR